MGGDSEHNWSATPHVVKNTLHSFWEKKNLFCMFSRPAFENPQGELCDRWKLNWTHEIKKNLDRISSWSSSSRGGEEQRDSFSFVFLGWVTFFSQIYVLIFQMGQQGSKESLEEWAIFGRVVVGTTMKVVQRAIVVTKDVAGLLLSFLLFFSSCFISLLRFASLLLSLFSLCVFDLFFCVWQGKKDLMESVFGKRNCV